MIFFIFVDKNFYFVVPLKQRILLTSSINKFPVNKFRASSDISHISDMNKSNRDFFYLCHMRRTLPQTIDLIGPRRSAESECTPRRFLKFFSSLVVRYMKILKNGTRPTVLECPPLDDRPYRNTRTLLVKSYMVQKNLFT